jgi:hypothetical protein
MNHLSFGRKKGRGLGNKNTSVRVFVRVFDGSFFDIIVREDAGAGVMGWCRSDPGGSRRSSAARQALGFVLRQSGQSS